MRQTVNAAVTRYTLDLSGGLTQVLYDETKSYVYGLDLLSQQTISTEEYLLRDGLGSIRQLTEQSSAITMFNSYEPYGEVFSSSGSGASSYGFAGEWTDETGLVHLRARYYSPAVGRFLSKDPYSGDSEFPHSFNGFSYANNNPVRFIDPSGWISIEEAEEADKIRNSLLTIYNVRLEKDWGYDRQITFHIQDAKIETIINCEWRPGHWRNLREMELVQEAVRDVARVLGGGSFPSASKFRAAMKFTVDIVRTPWVFGWGGLAIGFLPRPFGDIYLPDSTMGDTATFAKFTIAHELGHIWDVRSWFQLSRGMAFAVTGVNCHVYYPRLTSACLASLDQEARENAPGYVRDKYALTNTNEDWAESFASYVYPSRFPARSTTDPLVPGGLRETFIREQIGKLR